MYGELTRKPNGSLSSPARNLLTNKKILKILLKFEILKIQCKQQHELNKTLLLLFEITSASNYVREALPRTERSFESHEYRRDTAPVVNTVRFHKGNLKCPKDQALRQGL